MVKAPKKPVNPNLENLGTPPSHDVDWVCIPSGGKDLRYTIVKGKLWFAVRAEGQRRLGCAVHAQQVELMARDKMSFIRSSCAEVK